MAVAAMCLVQLGIAASVGLAEQIGSENVAWLRLVWAGLILLLIGRPWRTRWNRSSLLTCVWLGIATAALTILFMAAVVRLPLGTASALEFLGPLGVAIARGSQQGRIWAVVAGFGVLALTEPWRGDIDLIGVACALGAAVCWAAYIILTQRAGDAVSGLNALAISMPVAGVAATFVVGPSAFGHLDVDILLIGLGLAVLLPVIPFSLELLALRRLTAASFGTLMALEPAIALVIGLVVLGQIPGTAGVIGILLVVAAGVGAERNGARVPLGATAGEDLPFSEEGDEVGDLAHR